jgi:hypothetical protein
MVEEGALGARGGASLKLAEEGGRRRDGVSDEGTEQCGAPRWLDHEGSMRLKLCSPSRRGGLVARCQAGLATTGR